MSHSKWGDTNMIKKAVYKLLALAQLSFLAGLVSTDAVAAWNTLSPMNNSRFEASVVQYQDDLYVFNGFGLNIKVEPSVERFNSATKKWSVISNTSVATGTAVTHNGIVRNGNEVWLIGGRIGNHPGKVTNNVWIFNLNNQSWKRGPTMPKPVAAGGAALVNNKIHWFGGIDANAKCDVNDHFVYDLAAPGKGWQDMPASANMPTARNHFSTVVLNGLIYAIGGQHGHDGCPGESRGDVTLVHVFNPKTNKWVQKASLPAKQSHTEGSSLAYQGAIYVIGGEISGDEIYRYNPTKNQWDTVLSLPITTVAPIAAVVDDKLIVASGGAPNVRFPINITRSTDISALLLPGSTLASNNDSEEEPDQGTTEIPNTPDTPIVGTTTTDAVVISLEAERFDTDQNTPTHAWSIETMVGASDGVAIVTNPNNGALRLTEANSPEVAYFANFESTGTWYLWVRGKGDTNAKGEGRNDSLHAGLNGSLQTSADKIENFPASWTWSNSTRDGNRASINISTAGINSINLWMREDGLAVDKILLTQDANYQPTNNGPEQYDGTSTATVIPNTVDEPVVAEEPETVDEPVVVEELETVEEVAVIDETNNTNDNNVSQNNNSVSADGVVVIEVENFSNKTIAGGISWVESNKGGASGKSMVTNSDTGAIRFTNNNSPQMQYQTFFPQAGTYNLWVRGAGDTVNGEGKSDSVHIGINGALNSAQAVQNFSATWDWSNTTRGGGSATLVVPSSGTHTVNVWMREDGLHVDQLAMSLDSAWSPVGSGLVVTAGTNSPADSQTVTVAGTPNNGIVDEPVIDEAIDQVVNENSTLVSDDLDLVSIEIENYNKNISVAAKRWVAGNKPGFSGAGSMITSPDSGSISFSNTGSPELRYTVNFTKAGTYTVWARGWGDSVNGEGKSDSVHVGINGILSSAKALQNFPTGWNWSNEKRGGGTATVSVSSAGTHTINVWMREDGLILDKLVLSLNPDWTPEGFGPNAIDSITGTNNNNVNELTDEPATETAQETVSTLNVSSTKNWNFVTSNDGSTVQKRHEAGGVEFNGKFYVVGGRGSRNVSIYDPNTKKWSQGSAPPVSMHHFQPVVFGDSIWILSAFVGNFPDETPIANVYKYKPATDQWTNVDTIPAARRRGSSGAVVHDGLIYVLGGNTEGHRPGAVAWLDSYNPVTAQWRTLNNAPNARDHFTTAVVGNRLVAAAGRQTAFPNTFNNTLSVTDVYNFDTGNWQTGRVIPTERAGTMTVSVGQEVIVIGGESVSQVSAHQNVEAYNVTTNSWRTLKSLKQGRHSGAAAVVAGAIHVASGSENRGGAPESTTHESLSISP